jgi:hypothetical protein
MAMELLDMKKELEMINTKLDLINQTLLALFEQLEELDDKHADSLYNERDQSKPL